MNSDTIVAVWSLLKEVLPLLVAIGSVFVGLMVYKLRNGIMSDVANLMKSEFADFGKQLDEKITNMIKIKNLEHDRMIRDHVDGKINELRNNLTELSERVAVIAEKPVRRRRAANG